MQNLKVELLRLCLEYAEERVRSAELAIQHAKEASQDDTKSSAGDKYETTREMMQQEISRNEAQLIEARKLRHALSQIPTDKSAMTVQSGSLVVTSGGNFFISASAGQLTLGNEVYFAISSGSPIGRELTGKTKGDIVKFNNKEFKILEIL